MGVEWLFPTPVLHADLDRSPTASAMERELASFDRGLFAHQDFSDRNNLTGDLLGHAGLDQLHRTDAFQWLNRQLAARSPITWTRSSALITPEVHIQKAWPVVCAQDGGSVELHTHRNAQLSAVFYVKTEAGNDSGELEFRAPDDYFSHVMAVPFSDASVSGGALPQAAQAACVSVGPSPQGHALSRESPRYSVSYDLAITTASGQGQEMRVPHPMDWVPMSFFQTP